MTRRVRRARGWSWPLPLALTLVGAAACTTGPGPAARSGAPSAGTTAVELVVGDAVLAAELYDNPTAHDLADLLPVTVAFDDLHGLEKTGPLPRALTTRGVPSGADPEPREIGYYAPGRDLVLYYGDVGYFAGIVRIGRFSSDLDVVRDQPDGFRATLRRSG